MRIIDFDETILDENKNLDLYKSFFTIKYLDWIENAHEPFVGIRGFNGIIGDQ